MSAALRKYGKRNENVIKVLKNSMFMTVVAIVAIVAIVAMLQLLQ